MYEPSIRVPLLINYPKLVSESKTHDAMALNIDLAPTILDLAGLQSDEMQGRSLNTGRF